MKVRQLKHRQSALSRMACLFPFTMHIDFDPPHRVINWSTPEPRTFAPDPKIEELLTSMGMGPTSAVVPEPEQAEPEVVTYTVVRKKDGVVAGEYPTLEEANAAIAAAKRQKKAALELLSDVMASL